jgi:hypothetical protein
MAPNPRLVMASVEGPVDLVPTARGYRAVLRRVPPDLQRPLTRVVTAADGQRYIIRLTAALTTPLGRLAVLATSRPIWLAGTHALIVSTD